MHVQDFRKLSIGDEVIAKPFGKLKVRNQYTRVIFGESVAYVELEELGAISERDADCIGMVN